MRLDNLWFRRCRPRMVADWLCPTGESWSPESRMQFQTSRLHRRLSANEETTSKRRGRPRDLSRCSLDALVERWTLEGNSYKEPKFSALTTRLIPRASKIIGLGWPWATCKLRSPEAFNIQSPRPTSLGPCATLRQPNYPSLDRRARRILSLQTRGGSLRLRNCGNSHSRKGRQRWRSLWSHCDGGAGRGGQRSCIEW